MPEAEEEEQETENLFEKIMKENFPNLAQEIDIKVQETQRACPIEETMIYGPNERKDQNSRKRTNLSDAEFKTLVIRVLRELSEYSNTTGKEMKAALSEIKKNPKAIKSEGKETGTQLNNLEQEEEINIQPE